MILLPIVLLGLATKVYSHGFVQEVVLGETSYPGYHPYVDPYQDPVPERIIRKIPGISPVEQLDWIDVQCNGESATGYYTEPAPLLGKIAAGDIIKFNWISYGGAKDNHHGPMLTYMAKVPEGRDVREWSPDTEKVWFKIDHSGKDSEGKWAATDRLNEANGTYTARIPPNLQPGQYLIRHEWIALHLAHTYPGAQIYPMCVQVEVTGNGTAFPTEFVAFPGEYTAETPGIIFDVWNYFGPYPIPGPDVWTGGN